jgi:DNA-binding NtrC family response regulator
MNRKFEGFSRAAVDRMMQYSWPGNVRELRNVIERALVVAKGLRVEESDLSFPSAVDGVKSSLRPLDDVEREHIAAVLNQLAWNISRAAEVLAIDRATLYNKIKKYDLRK